MQWFISNSLIGFTLLCITGELTAQESKKPRFRLSGFGTLDVTAAGTKQLGYHNEFSHAPQYGGVSIFSGSVSGLQLDADLLLKIRQVLNHTWHSFTRSNRAKPLLCLLLAAL